MATSSLEGHLRLPAELCAGLAGVAAQRVHLGRPEQRRIDLDVLAASRDRRGETPVSTSSRTECLMPVAIT